MKMLEYRKIYVRPPHWRRQDKLHAFLCVVVSSATTIAIGLISWSLLT